MYQLVMVAEEGLQEVLTVNPVGINLQFLQLREGIQFLDR
jgi:hypothetical protein